MKKRNIKIARLLSYLVDLFVVSLIVTLVSQINFINPKRNEYKKALSTFEEFYETEIANVTSLNQEDLINSDYIKLTHDVQSYGISYTISEVVIILLYFTLFPYFNNGQTIGKKLLHLQYKNEKKGKIKLSQYFLRSLLLPLILNIIIYVPLSSIINIFVIIFMKGQAYLYTFEIISIIFNVFCYIDIIYYISSKENLMLHDKITNTSVAYME